MKIHYNNLREDARKIGIAFILGGGLGYFTAEISNSEALILGILGAIIWLSALIDLGKHNV